jgi:fatty acid synthase subunit beta
LKDSFTASLPEPTDELAQDDEPSSVTELVARYIGHVAHELDEGEDDASGNYLDVLKLVMNEFERAFMRGNDVHAVAAALPGIVAKKNQVVEAYYAGRAAAGRPTKPYDSALFRAASDETAGIYSVFGGQGNIEEYFDELRSIYNTYPSFVEDLITSSAELLQSLSHEPEAS